MKTIKANIQEHALSFNGDPLALYRHLCRDVPYTMLLESAEVNTKNALQSLLLVDAALTIACHSDTLIFEAKSDNGLALFPLISAHFDAKLDESGRLHATINPNTSGLSEDERLVAQGPFDGLRLFINQIQSDSSHPMATFLGGAISYDFIETFERLPTVEDGINPCPDYLFILAEQLLVLDHVSGQSELLTACFNQQQQAKLSARAAIISQKVIEAQDLTLPPLKMVEAEVSTNVSDEAFKAQVVQLKENIVAGDIFQAVPSRAFNLPCPNPLGAYQALRISNPSPYMFYVQADGFSLFGASPESALKYVKQSNQVEVYPIAGTRIRGKNADGTINADLDSRIELDLRLDKKELAEHIMLVDLARNDIARISEPGSRHVAELLKVDRYSHVMHLVSRVIGQLRSDLDALHAYQATMNMGTLVGAPKVRAATLVRNIEQTRRGSYGGAVGYLNGKGDMDSCIVIRSAVVHNGQAYVQAGAGVVFDSCPQAEADETRSKAQAVISAIKQGGGQ